MWGSPSDRNFAFRYLNETHDQNSHSITYVWSEILFKFKRSLKFGFFHYIWNYTPKVAKVEVWTWYCACGSILRASWDTWIQQWPLMLLVTPATPETSENINWEKGRLRHRLGFFFLKPMNARNGHVFLWKMFLIPFLGRMNSSGAEGQEHTILLHGLRLVFLMELHII